MGRLFARFFKENNCRVLVSGPTPCKGEKAARELDVEYIQDNRDAAARGDVVVVTVPIRKTPDVIKEVAPKVREGGLLMDLTSVKKEPVKLMKEYSSDGVEVIGTHPVFGPSVPGIEGQVFVLTPDSRGEWFHWLKDLLVKNKAKLIDARPEEHDEVMGVVQGLTHFTYISIAKTFMDLDFDVAGSRRFSSPVYDLMLDMIGRIIGQDPRLYAEIQMNNPRIPKIHDAYLEAAGELSRMVKEKDEEGFVKAMASSAKHYGDTEAAMGRSDKAINSLVYELRKLKDLEDQKVCVKHIYSQVMHYGVVEDVDAETLTLRDAGGRHRLKLSNIRLTSTGETRDFRKRKYGLVDRDYSVLVDGNADPHVISDMVSKMVDVWSVKVKDVYDGEKIPEGRKSVCLGVSHFQDTLDSKDKKVKELLKSLGWSLR